jgi:hypothetical protein
VYRLDREMEYYGRTDCAEENEKQEGIGSGGHEKSEGDKGVAKGPKVMFVFLLPPKDRGSGPCPHVERYDIHEDQDGQIQSTSISEILTRELEHQPCHSLLAKVNSPERRP